MTHWIIKYKPRRLDEIVGHESIVKRMKSMVQDCSLPHLIVIGDTGVGKTVTVQCMFKEMIPPEHAKTLLLEIDVSDERSCKYVCSSVEHFIQIRLTSKSFKYKYVIIHKADNMSENVQKEMHKIMDKYTASCRFCFIFSKLQQIIETIQSHSVLFRFQKIKDKDLVFAMKRICVNEKINHTKSALNSIATISQGDIRRAINNLQSAYYGYGKITNTIVKCMHEHTCHDILEDIIKSCEKNNLINAYLLTQQQVKNGFALIDMVQNIYYMIKCRNMNPLDKIDMLKKIGEVLTKHTDGSITNLCYMNLLSLLSESSSTT